MTPVFVWGRKRIGARLQPVAGGLLHSFKSVLNLTKNQKRVALLLSFGFCGHSIKKQLFANHCFYCFVGFQHSFMCQEYA